MIGDVQFRTLVAEIEGTLNQRPLTYVSEENTLKVLTPNDFMRIELPTDIETPTSAPDTQTAAQLRSL